MWLNTYIIGPLSFHMRRLHHSSVLGISILATSCQSLGMRMVSGSQCLPYGKRFSGQARLQRLSFVLRGNVRGVIQFHWESAYYRCRAHVITGCCYTLLAKDSSESVSFPRTESTDHASVGILRLSMKGGVHCKEQLVSDLWNES